MDDDSQEKKERVKTLVDKIKYHQRCYYDEQPEISDAEFDVLWDRLRSLDINNPIFSEVGKDRDRFFSKHAHIMPMGSLDKAKDEVQFQHWITKHPSEFYIVEHKLDGVSIELQYTEGTLVAAVTRGDGRKGDNVLINARKMGGVLLQLPCPHTFSVRGEVVMKHQILKTYFSDKANCRNAANGLIKRKDGAMVEHLDVICYDMWDTTGHGDAQHAGHTRNELEKLQLLSECGFTVVPFTTRHTAEEINTYRKEISDKRNSIGYDIDGLVVKMPFSFDDDMETLKPDRQIAYKFDLEYAQTVLLDVKWSESGHLYTPIGILKPVQLAGTTVQKASLVNTNLIKELGISIGAEVLVVKRGEIIPKIEKVVVSTHGKEIQVPAYCDICGSTIVHTGTRVFCPNIECRKRVLYRVERWIHLLEIYHWGDALLHRLVIQEKKVHKIGDLYRLSVHDLQSMERMGEILANKVLRSLHAVSTVSLPVFIAALGIDGVALLTAEKIVEAGYNSLDKIKVLDTSQLSAIDSIGPTLAQNIVNGLAFLDNEIDDVLQWVAIEEASSDLTSSPLFDKKICFSGAFSRAKKDLEKLVKERGGKVKSSVTKDLDYLVINDMHSTNSKNVIAESLRISRISENEFRALIQASYP